MYMFDNRITIEDRKTLDEYLDGYGYRTSGLSFSSLYMWRDINRFSWDIIGDYMCMCGISHLELEDGIILPFMLPPLTKTGGYDSGSLRETIFRAKELFEKAGQPFSLRLIPAHMLDIIKDAVPEMKFIDDRPNYDYIYLTQELAEFRGRAFHRKKNHLNYFKKNFRIRIRGYDVRYDRRDHAVHFGLQQKKGDPASRDGNAQDGRSSHERRSGKSRTRRIPRRRYTYRWKDRIHSHRRQAG